MGSSKEKCLAYIFIFILYNGSVYKVWCDLNSIEECRSYITEKLGGHNSAVEVITYLFQNGHPNKIQDPNIDPNIKKEDITMEMIRLNLDLECYIEDIETNVNGNGINIPTILEFCQKYATDKRFENSSLKHKELKESCTNAIKSFLSTNVNLLRPEVFTNVFKLALDKAVFSDDTDLQGLLTEFKNTIMKGATTKFAIESVFNVYTFCLFRYTSNLQHLINVKRVFVGYKADGTPKYEKYTSKKRRRNEGPSNQPGINTHD